MTEPSVRSTETTPLSDALPVGSSQAVDLPPAGAPPATPAISAAGCLRDGILVMLGAMAGVALALGLLFYVNGTLDFGRHERVAALASGLETLQSRQEQTATKVEQQETTLGELDADAAERVAQLGALAGQIDELETKADDLARQATVAQEKLDTLDSAVQTVAQENEGIRAQTAALAEQIALLGASAERFRGFVAGLRDLAASIAGPLPAEEPAAGAETAPAAPAQLPDTPALVFFPPLEPIPQPPPGQSLIYGLVWADASADGQPSADEAPLMNWMITLRDARGQELAAQITDANGRFVFDNLIPGSYTLVLAAPIDVEEDAVPQTITVTTGPDSASEVNFNVLTP